MAEPVLIVGETGKGDGARALAGNSRLSVPGWTIGKAAGVDNGRSGLRTEG